MFIRYKLISLRNLFFLEISMFRKKDELFFLVDDIYVLLVIRVNLFDIKGMIIVSLLVLCYVWIIRAHASYYN